MGLGVEGFVFLDAFLDAFVVFVMGFPLGDCSD